MTRKARSAFHVRLCLKAGLLRKPAKKTPARADLVPVAAAEAAVAEIAMVDATAAVIVVAAAVGIAAEIEDKV